MADYKPYMSGRIYGNVKAPTDLKLGEGAEIYGNVRLGKKVVVSDGAKLYGPLRIGNNVKIGMNARIGYPTLGLLNKMLEEHGKIVDGGLETVIGDDVFIDADVMIYEDSKIGNNVRIFHHATIREKVDIGDSSMIGCYTVIDGPYVKIGRNNFIHAQSYICSKTTMGDQNFFGPQSGTINEKTAQSRVGLPSYAGDAYRDLEAGPTIGNGCVIGEAAHLMMSVKLEDNAVVGAGALVTKDIPNGEVWIGNPAKKLKHRSQIPNYELDTFKHLEEK